VDAFRRAHHYMANKRILSLGEHPGVKFQIFILTCSTTAAERIAAFHGSQCGFCTPGFVVACHAALSRAKEAGRAPSPDEMQTALDGNLCRCTGYRPILDACKVWGVHVATAR